MKKLNFASLLLCIFAVSLLAGCATPILKSSSKAKQYPAADTSWYGKSGAQAAPILDTGTSKETSNPTATAVKKGSWWMPKAAPAGKEATVWGNRGYVYLAGAEKKLPAEKMALQVVYFPFDSTELTPPTRKILDANIKVLKEYRNAKIVLMGYASPEGSTDYNLKLSKNRALSVKDYLVKHGIPDSSISIKGEGEMEVDVAAYPIARKVYFKLVQ